MRFATAIALFGLFFTIGCSEELPTRDTLGQRYTLYSVLNPEADTQWVFVFPIQQKLVVQDSAALDATLQIVDLETQERMILKDSLFRDQLGHPVHVFWSPFTPSHGSKYRYILDAPGGDPITAEVNVPVKLQPTTLINGYPTNHIYIGPIPSVLHAKLVVTILSVKGKQCVVLENLPPGCELLPYEYDIPIQKYLKQYGSEYYMEVNLRQLYMDVMWAELIWLWPFQIKSIGGIMFQGIEVRVEVGSEDWKVPGRCV